MGVTLGRKVIKGGTGNDGGSYNLGDSLADKVDTFIGISGGNLGLTACFSTPTLPTCGLQNGFYPGYAPGPLGLSTYLHDLNKDGGKEADHVYTIFSYADEIICCGDLVYGRLTTEIPNEDGKRAYTDLDHFGTKDYTTGEQYQMITEHEV
mmetsp:Transcript_34140/g.30898  ORF Transcript_34140/g.30898 Transcript_34140/m.30898 type:complete len:151 (-) Transcript_34140:53-505(-)